MRKTHVLIFAMIFLVKMAWGQQGIVVKVAFEAYGLCDSDSNRTVLTYFVRNDIMRLDMKGRYTNSGIIYQPSSDKIWIYYNHEKLYFSMDAEEMDVMNSMVAQVNIDLKARYDSLSKKLKPIELQAWNQGYPLALENVEFKKVKKGDSLINHLLCRKYTGSIKPQNKRVLWVNDFESTGIEEGELEILKEFSNFMGVGTKMLAGNIDFTFFHKKKKYNGYPVLLQKYQKKNLCRRFVLEKIYRSELPDEEFKIPPGFTPSQNPLGYER